MMGPHLKHSGSQINIELPFLITDIVSYLHMCAVFVIIYMFTLTGWIESFPDFTVFRFVLKEQDLDRLERIVIRHDDLYVLSDEVYEHQIYDGLEHQSVLRRPGLSERSFAVFSFGKVFHITGWKVGYCVGHQPFKHVSLCLKKVW